MISTGASVRRGKAMQTLQTLKCLAAAVVVMLVAGTAHAAPGASTGISGSGAAKAVPSRSVPTDISSAGRRHYRYVRNRWRVVRPYASYGVYGPRPFYYSPYPFYLPFPFGFGVGFDPYFW
jgi:hypothetical protein